MSEFQRLVLRALGALLYCAVWRDHPVMFRQGEDARKKLIDELRDAAHSHFQAKSKEATESESEVKG